ncbi:MAG TPA: T9SS type A sorting domain-containing protein [Bacteroidales bacterium]|nr:T9SS type A sorting domain-containing protein [Bacteroidales bacterium]HPS16521.1 T9SS type A sorting domain-containing protein [Bacteroidales bacterium]
MLIPFVNVFCQIAVPVVIHKLPDSLSECSGVEASNPDNIWAHNDSGDKARIFNIDTLGNIHRILYFSGVNAIDCEDITQDDQGNYYIGDFGNNYNNRTDLQIYKISNPDSINNDSVIPQIIYFSFSDQLYFPPDSSNWNFDCEAMFHFNDSLYIFSKNRGVSTYSKMYRLPDVQGNYIAELVDSFDTQQWITSADISPSGKSMVLLSEKMIWLFTNYSGTDFFNGDVMKISMSYTQKEGIVFINDSSVYITDEKYMGLGANLCFLELLPWINDIAEVNVSNNNINIFPNPSDGKVTITFPENTSEIQIINESGQVIQSKNISKQNNLNFYIPGCGTYFIRVISDKSVITKKIISRY